MKILKTSLRRLMAILIICFASTTRPEMVLDDTFGTGGTIETDFDIKAIDFQTDGKIIIFSRRLLNKLPILCRGNPNGGRDVTFGPDDGNGRITESCHARDNTPLALRVHPDNTITTAALVNNKPILKHYTADGILIVRTPLLDVHDPVKDATGWIKSFFMSNPDSNDLPSNSRVLDIAIQPDNKIVVVGFVQNHDNPYGFIACFNPDQTLDKTFGPEGTGIIKNYQIKFFDKIALQPDGKIIVGSYQEAYSEDPYGNLNARIIRYTSNGILDRTFGPDGYGVHFDRNERVESITVQRDNKIVIPFGRKEEIDGVTKIRNLTGYYNPDTTPTCFEPGHNCPHLLETLFKVYMITFQTDGKILFTTDDHFPRCMLMRYRNMTPEEIEGRRLATLAAQQEAARLAAEEIEINALMGINFELCSICLEEDATQNLIETECHHSFHPACMAQWRNSGQGVAANRCPLCRADLPNLP